MAVILLDLDVSEMTSWLLSNSRREVQNEIKFHQQKKEIGLPLRYNFHAERALSFPMPVCIS